VTEFLAWILLLPLLAAVVLGIVDTGSARFSLQPVYAQLARVELFICLIFAYYWYQHFYQSSKVLKLAYWCQVLTLFAVPLLFLPKVLRVYQDYFSLAIWLSCFISLGLAWFTRYRLIILQAKLLVITAMVITAMSCLLELWQGLLALFIGALFMAFLHLRYLQFSALLKLLLRLHWQLSPYYFALVTAVIVHTLMSQIGLPHWGIVSAALSAYFVSLLNFEPVPLVLRASYKLLYLLLALAVITPLLLHLESGLNLSLPSLLYMLAQIVALTALLHLFRANGAVIRLLSQVFSRLFLQWGWHCLLAVSYLLWSYQLNTLIGAPLSAVLLVVHGSSLMFVSLKDGQASTIKLATTLFVIACVKVLLVDMVNFAIIQKTIAFMVIGVILLSVSYFYQKAKNNIKTDS
jgi:hypothetical protein